MKKCIVALLIVFINPSLWAQHDFLAQPESTSSKSSSREIRINAQLLGTLLQPARSTDRLVIIIPGSGPTDRNGNKQLTRNDALKKLAEGLAQQGIASFRYDKKVLTLLEQGILDEDSLRFEEFIENAVSSIRFFRTKNDYRHIYIIGHSQGSLVGMVAAQQTPVEGFISLAGAGQAIDKTILSQIALQMPGLEESAQQAFNILKEKGQVKEYNPALESILRPSVQGFMASWMRYNPQEEIKKINTPILIIGGTRDVQSSEKEFVQLQTAQPDATHILIPDMNHVLRKIEGNDLENTKSYNEPNRPIMTAVVDHIARFITSN